MRLVLVLIIGLIVGASINFATGLEWPWVALGHAVDIVTRLVTWPFVALSAVLVLMSYPSILKSIPLSAIDLFGTKFVFSKDKADEVSQTASELFSGVSSKVDAAFQLNCSRVQLEDCFRRTMEAIKSRIGTERWPDGFRATLHVSDVVYGDTLYQLLDYFPRGGGHGRRKSIRFGIIGLAFRSEHDQIEPDLQNSAVDLIRVWGMTGHEAAYASGDREAFACFVLRAPGNIQSPVLGLLYVDAKKAGNGRLFRKAAAADDYIGADIRAICNETKLLDKLADLKETMEPYATDFKVHN